MQLPVKILKGRQIVRDRNSLDNASLSNSIRQEGELYASTTNMHYSGLPIPIFSHTLSFRNKNIVSLRRLSGLIFLPILG